MRSYKLKLTVSPVQAAKIRCLLNHKKNKYPILCDPKSGVNIQPTDKIGPIEVSRGLKYDGLQRFLDQDLCDIFEGRLSTVPVSAPIITIEDGKLVLTFNEYVRISEDMVISEFVSIESTGAETVVLSNTGIAAPIIGDPYKKIHILDIITDFDAATEVTVDILATTFVDENDLAINPAIAPVTIPVG